MKIGYSSKSLKWNWVEDLRKDMKVLEVNRRSSKLPLHVMWIDYVNSHIKGLDLSIHSAAASLFSPIEQFTKTELEILRSEIVLAEMLGAKDIVFHMNLSFADFARFRSIVKLAKEKGVKLIHESDNYSNAYDTLSLLEHFPELDYNLDIGHFHINVTQGTLGMGADEFLAKVKDRTTYVHVHNNYGKKDTHGALADGNLDWKSVLDALDMKKVRKIIIEVRSPEAVDSCKKDLENYFIKRVV